MKIERLIDLEDFEFDTLLITYIRRIHLACVLTESVISSRL